MINQKWSAICLGWWLLLATGCNSQSTSPISLEPGKVCTTWKGMQPDCRTLDSHAFVTLEQGKNGLMPSSQNMEGTMALDLVGKEGEVAILTKALLADGRLVSVDTKLQTIAWQSDELQVVEKASGKVQQRYGAKGAFGVAIMQSLESDRVYAGIYDRSACMGYRDVRALIRELQSKEAKPVLVVFYAEDGHHYAATDGGLTVQVDKPAARSLLTNVGIDGYLLSLDGTHTPAGKKTVEFRKMVPPGEAPPPSNQEGVSSDAKPTPGYQDARRRLGDSPVCVLHGDWAIERCDETFYFFDRASGRTWTVPAFQCTVGMRVDEAAQTTEIFVDAGCTFDPPLSLPCPAR